METTTITADTIKSVLRFYDPMNFQLSSGKFLPSIYQREAENIATLLLSSKTTQELGDKVYNIFVKNYEYGTDA